MLEGLILMGSLLMLLLFKEGCWGFISMFFGLICFILTFDLNFEFWDFEVWLGFAGGDIMSLGLVYLSWWVVLLMFLAGQGKQEMVSLSVLYLILSLVLTGVFISLDFMLFYLMFEGVLIPMVILVVGWGYQPERLSAGIYLLLYTVFCSAPLLLVILLLRSYWGVLSCCFMVADEGFYGGGWWGFLWLGGLFAFLVSVPMYGLHLWLPKAHVEAPVSGSMLLAGVLLKLGGYGVMRFMLYAWGSLKGLSSLLISVSLFGGFYLSLVCLRQTDLKSLIAYSSVVHMGLVVGGVFTGGLVGWLGAYILMVGHGLCSSGLFYYAGVNYSRLGSRSTLLTKGFIGVFPSSVLFWFLFVSSNMSFPPSLNLLGEILLVGSLMGHSGLLIILLMLVSFLGGVYCLYLFSWVQHGRVGGSLKGGGGLTVLESTVSLMHWLPLNCMFLKSDMLYI